MKEKINNIQLSSIIILMFISVFIELTLFTLIKASGVDSYICIIISFFISFIYYFCFKVIFNYKTNIPIHKKINTLFCKPIAIIINCLLIISAFIISSIVLFNLETFIVSQFLSNTPLYVIGILFSLIVYYINIKGFETISRTGFIILIFNSILFFTAFIGLINSIEIDNFFPVLEHGVVRTFKGVFYILLYNFSPILFIGIIPKDNITDNHKSLKYIRNSVYYVYFIMSLVIIATIGSLGIYLASYFQYPEYIVLKKIDLFVFFDSVENILSIQWILGLFFNISFYTYYINTSLNIKKISYKVTLALIILTILTLTNSFKVSNTLYNDIIYNYAYYIGIILTIILLVLTIVIKCKKNDAQENNL